MTNSTSSETTFNDEKLDALIEAVEAGNNFGIIPKAQAVLAEFDPNYGVGETVCSAFDGSLDAAKALHEALVPDYDFETFRLHGEVLLKRIKPIDRHYGWADLNPARAWLLAILKAYRTQVTQ